MAELVNIFSWSISAREDFSECRRRRYWAKYAMWNGWKEQASELQRTAYRLSKMDNRFTLMGNAVERAVMWALRQRQADRTVTADQAYEAVVKPYLNQCWNESRKKLWQANPKRHCCLHEHYYAAFHREPAEAMTGQMISQVKLCIGHFLEKVLPALGAIRPEQELAIATTGTGDPESFRLEDVKVYAIPDYAYRADNRLHIHDWKSGNPKPVHRDQMAVYGLWANLKHHIPADQIRVHLEYLASGTTLSNGLTDADLNYARCLVTESVAEMAEYLEGGDIRKNTPLPRDDWELSADMHLCERCNFYELCQPELQA
ncbi:MAG: PD-(D/E)XK nuclease family protein [Verrucomicrobia bacterium]|nr:PD-(D/E)XK nuclease family protein [Verrucomicrobiota bacterium]MBU4292233.1 PD-(D/E)XK nuclease family protein [Verrucomicrobiota bacterium]MBU4428394.1 PD-(D/E)XK nuclease family protein [Verrucomicrobiota bacterium]MCG2679130.1 PD-(D/E)XK nuclease family protein [Kiritimatiellia bacterium]